MLRSREHKYIVVNGYAPQLFDLNNDPGETANLAGRSELKGIEKRLDDGIQEGWDGPALKKSVISDQQERLLIRSLAKDSPGMKWDYAPATAGPYGREA